MSYKALYRTYRPSSFSDVVGQKHIVQTLKNAIKTNKISHAYLFSGPRGTGKTSIAKIFANTLNCLNLTADLEPCFKCRICASLINKTSQDIIELDAASNNSADDVRQLRDTLRFLPAEGKYKIYIIDEVHMLSNAAFNALLKTLEEPPSYVIFILATTEPHKLPNTILSRVQRFDFKNITENEIKERLAYIASEEGISVDDSALTQIARFASGGLRDALSLFDQIISFAGDDRITSDLVFDITGSLSEVDLGTLLSYLLVKDYVNCFLHIDELLKSGKDISRLLLDFINFLKDILIYKETAEVSFTSLSIETLWKFKDVESAFLFKIIHNVNETLNNMRFSMFKKAYIDCFILNCCSREDFKPQELDLNSTPKIPVKQTPLKQEVKHVVEPIKTKSIKDVAAKEQAVPELVPPVPESVSTIDDVNLPDIDDVIEPTPASESANANFVDKEQIVNILNNPNKDLRLRLIAHFEENQAYFTNKNTGILTSFLTSNIVCASMSAVIVTFKSKREAISLMNSSDYFLVLDFFKQVEPSIEAVYCFDNALWQVITKKYLASLKQKIPLSLADVVILIPNPPLPKRNKKLEFLQNIFNNNLKIKED